MPPKSIARTPTPLERDEMRMLSQWMTAKGLVFFHPFNEGKRAVAVGRYLKMLGLSKGVPDVFVFNLVPKHPEVRGVAIELKRIGHKKTSKEQDLWLAVLERCGWKTCVAEGCQEAIKFLISVGF
jgi:hypothetical protein